MARRQRGRKTEGGVQGPSSALTAFLKSEGITDAFRARREREREQQVANNPTEEPEALERGSEGSDANTPSRTGTPEAANTPSRTGTPDSAVQSRRASSQVNIEQVGENRSGHGDNNVGVDQNEDDDDDDDDDDEIRQMKRAAKRKLRAARRGAGSNGTKRRTAPGDGSDGDDSDDSDKNDNDNYNDDDDDELQNVNMKKFGEDDTCVDCGDRFELSVYSRFIKEKTGYLCDSCNQVLRERERKAKANQLAARKKRRKVAQALLNKSTVKLPKLQDVCIKKITQNIEDVDALGDIGQMNLNKIAMILSKNRSLNDKTISLFLSPDLKHLEFWDCSNVDSDSLNKIASFCPNLESLTLFMCGQLHNDNLEYFASNLKHLHSLSLNGPFLISDRMWQSYFEQIRGKFVKFEVRNTHRFGNESLLSLLECCGNELTSLKLSRLDGITKTEAYQEIPKYISRNKLVELEISYPTNEDLITDELLIDILAITGESLNYLNVDGCSGLTEKFLLEGVSKYCRNLTRLSMKNLDQVSNEGFAKAFEKFSKVNAGGLLEINLMKCTDLGDDALYALFNHSCHTLVEMSINSLYRVSKDFLSQIFTEDAHQFKINLRNKAKEDSSIAHFHAIKLPLLTYLDASFVRAVDNEILTLISENCPKLQIIEVYGDNRCTNKAVFEDSLMVIGRQTDDL